jgi:hypothetical protein
LENIERIKRLRKIVAGIEAEHIIEYVKKNPGTTIDKVAKHLQEEKICSRLTTLKVINILLEIGLLKDQRMKKYFHSLYINKDYDPSKLVLGSLIGILDEIKDTYNKLTKDDEPAKIIDELKGYTIKLKYKKPRRVKTAAEKAAEEQEK